MINQDVDAVFEDWDQGEVPGGAVTVLKRNEVIYCRSYGFGNLEAKSSFSLSLRFSIASITKQFTTFCILLLEHNGKLSLNDDVRRYFPELADFGLPITIRHLCHNSSGIRDFITLAPMTGGQLLDKLYRGFILELISRQRTLNFAPGTQYRYSNSNFVILSYIIERLTDMPLGQVFVEWLFKPLGMSDSVLVEDSTQRPDKAIVGYEGDQQSGFKPWGWNSHMSGDGGIWSTMNDMILWEKNFDHNVIGPTNLIERMYETRPLNDGALNDYALGLHTGRYRGVRYQSHGGGFAGYMSQRTRFPDERLSIIVFANHTDNLIDRTFKVADLFLQNAAPIENNLPLNLQAPEIRKRLGFYQDTQSGIGLQLNLDNDTLMLDVMGLLRPLRPESPSRFGPLLRSLWKGWVEFGSLAPEPTMIVSLEQGAKATVTRVEKPQNSLNQFEGSYHNDELLTTYTLNERDNVLELACDGLGGRIDGIALERKGPDTFSPSPDNERRWATDGDIVLWFPPNSAARRKNLVVSCYGAEGVRFRLTE